MGLSAFFGRLSFGTTLSMLMAIRAIAALLSHVYDCDEVFNYWEPLHYLVHGTGLQTWEYSPVYGLRSYFYLLPHAVPALILKYADMPKDLAFAFTRGTLGFASAYCEASLCHSIKSSKAFGKLAADTSGAVFMFLAFSSGMFHASVALLPSSTAMYLTMLAISNWLKGNDRSAIFAVAATTILVWPFSGAIGVPIAFDIVLRRAKFTYFVKSCILALMTFLPISILIDSVFYGKLVFPAFNIVMYNVLSGSTSSELYGTEPWTFYFFNCFLNLNIAFALAFLGPIAALVFPRDWTVFLTLCPMLVWFGIFFPQAHKEERFIFPVYPVICLSAGYALVAFEDLFVRRLPNMLAAVIKFVVMLSSIGFIIISISRTTAMYKGYHAPMKVYGDVAQLHSSGSTKRLCIGKEWYRYSSSFYLPDRSDLNIEFIKSGYDGLLPKPFEQENGTSVVPTFMNNMNREEPTRYVDIAKCDFIVDQAIGEGNELEPNFRDLTEWNDVSCYPFLDPGRSHPLLRAFYVPYLSEKKTAFNQYCLHKRA